MMRLSKIMLLWWVLGAGVVLSEVYGNTGNNIVPSPENSSRFPLSFKEPATSPIISPDISENRYGTPVVAPLREIPRHLPPADNSHFEGSSHEISPAQYEVRNYSYTAHTPPDSGVFPVIAPAPNEFKNLSNTTHAPSTSQSGSSAAISTVSFEPKNPSNTAPVHSTPYPRLSPAVSPAPDEVENHSTITLAPPSRHSLSPMISPAPPAPPSHPSFSPMISPAPHEINNSSNYTSAPVMSPPGYSPVMSPAMHEIENPSNVTHGTHTPTSHPSPSPVISPAQGNNIVPSPEKSSRFPLSFKEPATSPIISPVISENRYGTPVAAPLREIPRHLPPADNSHFEGSSHEISPAQYEVRNSTYTAHTPPDSGVFPVITPAPNEFKNLSNTTHAPSTSQSGSSAAISPVSFEPKNPSNTAPVPSTPYPRLSPAVSPAPDEVENHSTTTLAPPSRRSLSPMISPAPPAPPSHPSFSPMISPAPHEINNSSNYTSASVMSPPGYSPVMSPAMHEIENPSNGTHGTHTPSTSHRSPSPVISPAQGKNFSNVTHAPQTSQPGSYPVISPMPSNMTHEFRNPSNQTGARSASQPNLPPVISPAPNRNSSNITHAPVISNPGSSYPVISPVPPVVKNLPNTTHAPLASHPSPAPMITPAPHEITSTLNITPAPLTSRHNSSPRNHSNYIHAPLTSQPSLAPVTSPKPHNGNNPPIASHSQPPEISTLHSPASPPTTSTRHHAAKRGVGTPAPSPFSVISPSTYPGEGPVISPAPLHPPVLPKGRRRHHEPPLPTQGPFVSPDRAPSPSTIGSPAPSPSSGIASRPDKRPIFSPVLSPYGSSSRKPRVPMPSPEWALPSPPSHLGPIHSPVHSPSSQKPKAPSSQPVWRFPSPPPNYDCNSLTCSEPLANSPPGSPCACVLPIKVGFRLSVALYTFFPLVSELAREIAAGIFMKQSQVRIMGANAATEPEKTIVLIDLVPLGRYYDNTTANLVYIKFWHKQVIIDASLFGDYDVIYVKYPGLPASPPTAPSDINVDDGTYGSGNNGRTIRPLGVDVRKHEKKVNSSLIAIIVLSSVIGLVFVMGATWLLMLRYRDRGHPPALTSKTLLPTIAKASGTGLTILGSVPSSTSASFSSSIVTYTGSAKTFTLAEIERATNRFDDSRIIGEGGFGRVYQGTLEDGTIMAVKVLKRDDQQGGREFLAEVEMLSRLHHRNLVKLIGICTEDTRCLVYELVPNGSVESHLHGMDKKIAPLDWGARVKIALGAARGLAYLHEDSSPRVIHRDFKSSNILLEYDFTPKVSDFGLARAAVDGGNEQISTRVMGTFGYVAPEYAMTGHLLVKSDVYSYGVVLLELLSGRKPVDMSQPPGQENLVTWARPLLTSLDGLETIIDPALGADVPFDSVAKVAAIASMCVQPEVSHRPFMGEVVQALKLVCNENDEYRPSVSCSQEELFSAHETDIRISTGFGLEEREGLSTSDRFSTSARFTRDTSSSFRRHSSSGPLRTSRNRPFWQRIRGPSSGSVSEHGVALRYMTGLEDRERWS